MKKFFEEFKAFAMRGNVVDMAIGVIIGGAFGKITTSLVNDIFMPLLGLVDNCRVSPDTSRYYHPERPVTNCDYAAGNCCIANAYHATGSVTGVYEDGCKLFRKRMECAIMVAIARALGE